MPNQCSISECDARALRRGWCDSHYQRWRRNGGPSTLGLIGRPPRPAPDRFWVKVDKSGKCWLWTGARSKAGYGQFRPVCSGKSHATHRYAYELLVGPIPDGLTLDHLCHNADNSCRGGSDCPHRACVWPDHLEPATRGENVLRGVGLPAQNARKTHCVRGHPFNLANTYRAANGYRMCRACCRIRARRRARQKQSSFP